MGLFGSIAGALFGGKKKTTKTEAKGTTDVDPYAPTIPYINDYLADSAAMYKNTPQISAYEQAGYDQLKQVAGAGGQALNPAIAENNKTLSGQYLDPNTNPYLAGIAERMSGAAAAASNSAFGGRGRSGGGLAGYYAGKGAADATGDALGSHYEAERARMAGAVGLAPGLEAGRYLAPQALISAGQNISARPYDIAQQRGGILAQIAGLGQQGSSTGTVQNYKNAPGLFPAILSSFSNKLFGTDGQ